jgi:hypothetical protein
MEVVRKIFYGVFGPITQKNSQKNTMKKALKNDILFFLNCFVKFFDMDFFNFVYGVSELPLLRSA